MFAELSYNVNGTTGHLFPGPDTIQVYDARMEHTVL